MIALGNGMTDSTNESPDVVAMRELADWPERNRRIVVDQIRTDLAQAEGAKRCRPRRKANRDRTAKALHLLAETFPDLTGEQAAAIARTLAAYVAYCKGAK